MRRWVVALAAVLVAAAAGVGVALAASSPPRVGGGSPGSGPVALSYSVTKVADAVDAPGTTFESVVPACGCGRGATEIAQFSLRTGRRVRTLARIRTSGQISAAVSDRSGDLWMTFTAGPRLRSGVAGGDPQPDSCTSALVRYDPSDGAARTVRRFARSVTIGNAIPSPDGSRVAVLAGGCATSFFNQHIDVIPVTGGPTVSIGAAATPCHSLFDVAWNPAGTELLLPFGRSRLRPHTTFQPRGVCDASRFSRLAVVSAMHPSEPGDWTLWRAQPHCSYQAAAFAGADEGGPDDLVAAEACSTGLPKGSGGSTLGRAYLVRVAGGGRILARHTLPRAWDGGDVVADPATGQMLVSEDEAANSGVRAYDWVWSLDGSRLRVLDRIRFLGADDLNAQPY